MCFIADCPRVWLQTSKLLVGRLPWASIKEYVQSSQQPQRIVMCVERVMSDRAQRYGAEKRAGFMQEVLPLPGVNKRRLLAPSAPLDRAAFGGPVPRN